MTDSSPKKSIDEIIRTLVVSPRTYLVLATICGLLAIVILIVEVVNQLQD